SIGRRGQTGWLFLSGNDTSAETYLCLRNDPSRRQSSGSPAVARTQRHLHDSALCGGYPTRPTTRVPRRPPACVSTAPCPSPLRPHLRPHRRPRRNPPDVGCHTSSSRDVPSAAFR